MTQAGAIGYDGEAFVSDIDEAVMIDEVARPAREASRPLSIAYAGLRTGGMLHEALLGDDEPVVRPLHPLISHAPVPTLDPIAVRGLELWADPVAVGTGHEGVSRNVHRQEAYR